MGGIIASPPDERAPSALFRLYEQRSGLVEIEAVRFARIAWLGGIPVVVIGCCWLRCYVVCSAPTRILDARLGR